MSWKCSCGTINAGLLERNCAYLQKLPNWNHQQISVNSLDSLRIYVATKEIAKNMTPDEELFATYYNRGKIQVSSMDDTGLREHREQLRKIATEAKAHLIAADDEIRERQAKKGNKDWLVTTDTSQSVSDAINVVEKRRARMSKMDKLKQQLIDLGMDDETIRQTIGGLERRATEQRLKSVTFKKKTTEIPSPSVIPSPSGEASKPNPFSRFKVCEKCKQNPCRCDGLTPVLA
jgi:hypothetical protein